MNVIQTKIEGAFLIEPDVFGDNRGWFMESYSYEKYAACGIQVRFVQDNRSRTQHKGTIRGLHCQTNPKAQSKLLTCTRGALLDVAVDIPHASPSDLKWIGVELTEENKKQPFIPKGCLHGFLTLTDDVEVEYKVDEYYAPENDRSIRFDDPALGVLWGLQHPILSAKDQNAPLLAESDVRFIYPL